MANDNDRRRPRPLAARQTTPLQGTWERRFLGNLNKMARRSASTTPLPKPPPQLSPDSSMRTAKTAAWQSAAPWRSRRSPPTPVQEPPAAVHGDNLATPSPYRRCGVKSPQARPAAEADRRTPFLRRPARESVASRPAYPARDALANTPYDLTTVRSVGSNHQAAALITADQSSRSAAPSHHSARRAPIHLGTPSADLRSDQRLPLRTIFASVQPTTDASNNLCNACTRTRARSSARCLSGCSDAPTLPIRRPSPTCCR